VGFAQFPNTNPNHTRAATRVGEPPGARVAIHPADAAYARDQGTAIDAELQVGERAGPFIVVGVPGKSPGEIALHDPARRLLVVGDAVIGNPPGRLSLLRERVMDDPARLRASVRSLLELDFDALMLGDGVPIREGGRERLRELVASFPTD
jgi:glyoxylase-like metal-dependent hydrolase (beta-lactamase superfamily II)